MVAGGDEPADVLSRRRDRRLKHPSRDFPPGDQSRRHAMIDLGGKVAVVTGASRGLGQRVAARLAAHGASVVLVARSESALAATVGAIVKKGGRAEAVTANLSDPRSVDL